MRDAAGAEFEPPDFAKNISKSGTRRRAQWKKEIRLSHMFMLGRILNEWIMLLYVDF